MKKTRRDILRLFSWIFALPVLSGLSTRGLAAAVNITRQEVAASVFFKTLGFHQLPAVDLITDSEFNDGLRFDESLADAPTGKTFRIQNCGRIEDLAEKGTLGVLPYFHIFAVNIEKPAFRGELLTQIMSYLISQAKLDPGRLLLVSTNRFQPYLQQLQPFGINASQFIERDYAEAIAAGDGSGFFNPPGHPHVNGAHSVSIHYASDASTMGKPQQYPLPGFLELGEIGIDAEPGEIIQSESAGLGVERILMAQGIAVDDFPTSQQKALAAIKSESELRGVPLPKAYQKIADA